MNVAVLAKLNNIYTSCLYIPLASRINWFVRISHSIEIVNLDVNTPTKSMMCVRFCVDIGHHSQVISINRLRARCLGR